MSAVPDRSESGPYLGGCSSLGRGVLLQAGQGPGSSGGRAMSPTAPTSVVPDRSEIGPYLGGCSNLGRGVLLQADPGPASSGGRAMSPTAPCLRCWTARRSVPTSEAVRVWDAGSCYRLAKARRAPGGRAMSPTAPMSAVPDRSEIGPYLGGSRVISGRWGWSMSEGGVSPWAVRKPTCRRNCDPTINLPWSVRRWWVNPFPMNEETVAPQFPATRLGLPPVGASRHCLGSQNQRGQAVILHFN